MLTCQFENGGTTSLRHITVAMLVLDKEKRQILLVKRANIPQFLEPNKIGLPGGFMDRDENTQQAVKREVEEETGYRVTIEKLFRINDNPHRPKEDRQNVEIIFIGSVGEKIGEHDKEIAEVIWVPLNNLPKEELFAFDHLENIKKYLSYLQKPFSLPLLG